MIEKNHVNDRKPKEDSRLKGTKHVRTVVRVLGTDQAVQTDAEHFDDEVNQAIRDGWKLSRRYAIASAGQVLLVAELVRYV